MADPIVVDIGAAMQTLEANPELGRMMNELVLGPVVTEQLAAQEAEIARLREYYEASEEISQVGMFSASEEMWERLNAARATLKEPTT